jgi:hypothetical protein
MGCPHATPKATEAAAPEATEASTAAPRRIAGTPTHGYEPTRGRDGGVREELAAGLRETKLAGAQHQAHSERP